MTTVVMAMGTGLLNPAKSALISRGAPDDEQGAVLGSTNLFLQWVECWDPSFQVCSSSCLLEPRSLVLRDCC